MLNALTDGDSTMTQPLTRIGSFLHPLLFAAFPLLSLFAQNQTDVPPSVLRLPVAPCLGGAAALYGLLLLITRRATIAGALASVIVVGLSGTTVPRSS